MSQFDVFRNPDPGSQTRIPFIVVLQSDLLDAVDNHVVAPLCPKHDSLIVPVLRLNPRVTIDSEEFLVRVQDLATVPRRMLREKVTNLSAQREEILAALDFLFTGF